MSDFVAHIAWPQVIIITLILIGGGTSAYRYGEQKKPDSYDWIDLTVPVVMLYLLWWGGFFTRQVCGG